jgi:TonB family protein
MIPDMLSRIFFYSSIFFIFAGPLSAQSAPAAGITTSATAPEVKLDYPNSASGLEHLVKDILKAQKTSNGARADALLKSLVLPDPRGWYDRVFGVDVGNEPVAIYEKSAAAVAPGVASVFLNAEAENLTDVTVVRFDKSCDDNAGEDAFGILHARIEPVPLYEVRLQNGNKFMRLFALAYVNDGFRYIITPKMDGKVFHSPASNNPAAKSADAKMIGSPIRAGGAVQAAKLIQRVQPEYPRVARDERLQGTVRLRALIAKDGSLARLYVIKGYCSLADSALKAVSQWRYAPTLFNGEPVEIDTEITVVFQLQK